MEDAIFDMREGTLGLLPDLVGTTRLLRLMGNSSYVRYVVIAARRLTGKDAFRMGFVNGVSLTKEGLEEQLSALVNEGAIVRDTCSRLKCLPSCPQVK
ncbi:hypothetical protein LCGC14_0747040 [marine sediment metagenome]|uniref:Uncharacterized protein n=1 Tax=marine sediment metagenome TaxID=412755 RepID=A0A0F9QPX6_9ZZZZ